ncbi:MAG: septal ring lytic transglycosylase RlpA family protein [Pseudomonadota bacterium]
MNAARPVLALLALAILLAGCSQLPVEPQDGAPAQPVDVSRVPDAVPRAEPYSKYGNPPSYQVNGKTYFVKESATDHIERGRASWYGTKFHGKRTSSGEPYDMYAMTAAHRTLPLPTYAEVTNLDNGRKVVVKINDRGPFHEDRILDLSYAAASKLGILASGTGRIELRAISLSETRPDETAAAPPPAAGELFYLQVASFNDRGNAQTLVSKLLDIATERVELQQTAPGGGDSPVYRVRIGPFRERAQAEDAVNRLNHYGLGAPLIVVD